MDTRSMCVPLTTWDKCLKQKRSILRSKSWLYSKKQAPTNLNCFTKGFVKVPLLKVMMSFLAKRTAFDDITH